MSLPSKNSLLVFGVAACVVLVCVGALCFVATKAGLIRPPFFGRWYQGPHPTRVVDVPPIPPRAFQKRLEDRLNAAVRSGRHPFVLTISEQELTGGFKAVIDDALRDKRWKQLTSQIVVRPTDFEMFCRYARGPLRMDLFIRFAPEISGRGVVFHPTVVQFGDFHIPTTFAERALSVLFNRDLGRWDFSLPGARLSTIKLRDRAVDLAFTPGP